MLNSVAHTLKRKALGKLKAFLARFDEDDHLESYEEESSIYEPEEFIIMRLPKRAAPVFFFTGAVILNHVDGMGWMEQNLSQQITAKNIHEAESLASKFSLQSLMNQNMNNLKVLHLSDSETHIRRLKKFAVTADLALFTFWSDIFDIMRQFRHLTCEAIYREGNLAHYPANVHRLEANLGLDGEDGNLIRKRDILKLTYEDLVDKSLRGDPYFVFRYKGIDPLIPPTKGEADHTRCSPSSSCGSVDCVIVQIGRADDRDRFLERLTTPTDPRDGKSWRFPIEPLRSFIILHSVKCITSVVHHIDFYEVDKMGLTPLCLSTLASCPELVKLFLEKGALTDVRLTDSVSEHDQMLPLNYSLHLLSKYMIYFNVLTPEQSLYKMLITLCLPQLRSKLECVRLLAEKTEELGEEIYYYAKHGRLVELAVLLLVARDKVTSASLVKNSSSLNEKDCRNLDHCMSLREFIVFELGQLSALEVKLEFHCENGKLLSCCKEKQNLMISALLLLEIFERAGKTIESYLKTQMPQEKIVQILEEAGFYLEDRDTDMSHVESFSWPSFLMMCSVPTIGKHAEKPNQLALGLHETYKKHNYVCSLPTLKYHREWLGFHTPLGTELHRPLQSSLQTLPMPQVCCVFGNQV